MRSRADNQMELVITLIGLASITIVLALYRLMERRERRLADQGRGESRSHEPPHEPRDRSSW